MGLMDYWEAAGDFGGSVLLLRVFGRGLGRGLGY